MADIKLKNRVKGTVKTLNRAANVGDRMKDAYVRTKDKAEHSTSAREGNANEYAADRMTGATETVSREAVHVAQSQGTKVISGTKDTIVQAQQYLQHRKAELPKRQMQRQAEKAAEQAFVRKSAHKGAKTIKTVERTAKTIKHGAKSTVKTAKKTVKTADKTTRAIIKANKEAAKATKKAALVAKKAARRAADAARAAERAAISMVRAIIRAIKSLISFLIAGGWIVVLVIVVICLVAMLVSSVFGIFFSSEDTGSAQTMQDVVREINGDYQAQIETNKANINYDILEMSGSRAVWPDVLAVYAVKTTSDPDNPQEVATMNDSKKAILKDIFWQMNTISTRTETREETVIEETDDGAGNIVETETVVTRTVLYITVSHKTAEEMASHLGFNQTQKDQLAELLVPENRQMWAAVLYGIGTADDQIVLVAKSQVGNVGGDPYWSWYGFHSRVAWCACFVSWCANECGYIENGIIPKFAGCVNGVNWFRDRGQWADNNIEPTPGMILFFDWDAPDGESGPQDGLSDHVGIVEKVENGRVYTVEGNSSDSCREKSYPVGYYEILGYGIPDY